MKLRLPELQESNAEAKKLRSRDLSKSWEYVENVLQHEGLLYISKIICSKIICCYRDDPLAGQIIIKKTREMVVK